MKAALMLLCVMGARSAEAAPDALCASLLELQRIAESQGRIDLNVVIETNGDSDPITAIPHVRMGPQYTVGRIHFSGNAEINDSTLRRAFTLRERDLLDIGKLRRSLTRLNDIGLAAPVSFADIVVTRQSEATADITIPLRKRGRRWWSLSGPIIPGLGSYQASISSRLPVWGRGVLDTSTYLLTFNALALAKPSLGILKLFSNAPPAVVLLERPLLPGQEWVSGFAVSPTLSLGTTSAYYARAQLGRGARAVLEDPSREALVVPVVGTDQPAGQFLVCQPARSGWRWLRRGAIHAIDVAIALALP